MGHHLEVHCLDLAPHMGGWLNGSHHTTIHPRPQCAEAIITKPGVHWLQTNAYSTHKHACSICTHIHMLTHALTYTCILPHVHSWLECFGRTLITLLLSSAPWHPSPRSYPQLLVHGSTHANSALQLTSPRWPPQLLHWSTHSKCYGGVCWSQQSGYRSQLFNSPIVMSFYSLSP